MAERVSDRAINRSYLARQLLLERSEVTVIEAIEHLVGLQAQDVMPPYIAMWTRLREFNPRDLEELLESRAALRLTLMRGTVHLVSKRDALRMRPLLQPEVRKAVLGSGPRKEATEGIDLDALAAFGEQVLSHDGVSMAELTAAAAKKWPERDARLVAQSASLLVAATQVPPRGLWKRNDRPRWAMLDQWCGESPEDGYPLEQVIWRYLQAFGPARFEDIQTWSRLTGLRPAFEAARPDLRSVTDAQGRELFDVPDAPWPDPEIPAPVRFLGAFDNLWLAHKDRTRIVDPAHFPLVMMSNGVGRPTILVDGRIAARYRVEAKKGIARLTIQPFRPLSRAEQREIETEGVRLLGFLEPGQEYAIAYDDSLT